MNDTPDLLPSRSEMERAFAARDASYDGIFYVAVRTTGIFCRPSCPSRPRPEHLEFFGSTRAALAAGYRPCQRCHPLGATGAPPPWARQLMEAVEKDPNGAVPANILRDAGVSPERARRWFKTHYGMSFAAWRRSRRLASAFAQLRDGASVDDAAFDSGYASHSGFREAFVRAFGQPPGRARATGKAIMMGVLESPLGPLLAGAEDSGVCLLEFFDRRMLETNLQTLRRRFAAALVPGDHRWIQQLSSELSEYFEGVRREFSVPLAVRGAPFQEKVWDELRRIPYGATRSYEELARAIGQPSARRAVARANGDNRIAILIPCHRVIGKDGSLTGYGGGLWRKRALLELERSTRESNQSFALSSANGAHVV